MDGETETQPSTDAATTTTKKRGRKKKEAAPANGEAKPAKKRGRPKQERIPGTERPERIEPIERAAVAYEEVRNERMALTKAEVKAKAVLHDAMKQATLTKYSCDSEEIDVEIVPAKEENVKVKRRKVEIDDVDADNDGGDE